MKMNAILLFTLLGIFSPLLHAKFYDKCSLTRELSRLGVSRSEMPDWVCIAQWESTFNTRAMNINKNRSKDWGIFQINDVWWCDPQDGRKSHNICKVACNDLLSDDVTKAVRCAQTVKRQQGYKAWVAWNSRCQGSKPSVNECF